MIARFRQIGLALAYVGAFTLIAPMVGCSESPPKVQMPENPVPPPPPGALKQHGASSERISPQEVLSTEPSPSL